MSQPALPPLSNALRLAGNEARRLPTRAGQTTQADLVSLFERLSWELDADHARQTQRLEALRAETARLVSELTACSPATAAVKPIPEPHAVPLIVMEQIRNAKSDVALIHLETDSITRNITEITMPTKLRALERGVDLRVIYPPRLLIHPILRQNVTQQLEVGGKVRLTRAPTIQMFLFDGRFAVVTRPTRSGSRHAVMVGESILVGVLYLLFDAWWAEAKDAALYLADSSASPSADVSCEERILLHLLGDGLTDETMAHQLGISVRTVRRRVATLLRQLKADSRFQAGVLVTRRGWL